MFAKTADFIMKHSKLVIVAWLAVLLVTLPIFGIHSGDKLQYELTEMSGVSSESIEGQQIIDDHFTNSTSMNEIAVIVYPDQDSKENAASLGTHFKDLVEKAFPEITVRIAGSYEKTAGGSGVYMFGIT